LSKRGDPLEQLQQWIHFFRDKSNRNMLIFHKKVALHTKIAKKSL
jgi:hypothetical protein